MKSKKIKNTMPDNKNMEYLLEERSDGWYKVYKDKKKKDVLISKIK